MYTYIHVHIVDTCATQEPKHVYITPFIFIIALTLHAYLHVLVAKTCYNIIVGVVPTIRIIHVILYSPLGPVYSQP